MLNVKTYYFIYDKETYVRDNGLNLDIETEMPGCSFRDAKELVAAIETGDYPQEELDKYRQRFLPDEPGSSTGAVADIIESCMKYGDD